MLIVIYCMSKETDKPTGKTQFLPNALTSKKQIFPVIWNLFNSQLPIFENQLWIEFSDFVCTPANL